MAGRAVQGWFLGSRIESHVVRRGTDYDVRSVCRTDVQIDATSCIECRALKCSSDTCAGDVEVASVGCARR